MNRKVMNLPRVGLSPSWLMALGIFLSTLILFLPAYWCDFIYLDDHDYVTGNLQVQRGMSWEGVGWAFTTSHASNWHPLTWLSHMMDCSLFGLNPGPHHLMNVLLHGVNAVLVFWLWQRLTVRPWAAFFIAALFAWHPLRLESVVWIAERKDVLSASFGLGTLICYVRYVRSTGGGVEATPAPRYLWLALGLFALGLMAKPMLVTLPCVMLLLDFWPLQRRDKPGQLIREKAPFWLVSFLSCAITVWAQRQEAIVKLENFPLEARLANVLVSYVGYLKKILYPVDLAIFYPMPPHFPVWQVTGAAAVLLGFFVWAWRQRQRQPWLLMGWCWFLGMLVPVIGLVQVGWQANADRYTYWPGLGLGVAIVMSVRQSLMNHPRWKLPVIAGGIVTLLAYMGLTVAQLPYWRNAETLGTRAIEVTQPNIIGHQIRGKFYYEQGRYHEALVEYEQVLALLPNSARTHNDLGNLLSDLGRKPEALGHYQMAIQLAPRMTETYNNMAVTLAELGRYPEAVAAHAKAMELAPTKARPYYLTGRTYWRQGQSAEATRYFRQALELNPQDYQSLTMLARILASAPEAPARNGAEAVALAQWAVELTGGEQPLVLDVLAMAYAEQGNFFAAQRTIAQAITLAKQAQATNLLAELETHAAVFAAQQPWRQPTTSTNSGLPAGQ